MTFQQWQQVFFMTNLQYSSSLHAIAVCRPTGKRFDERYTMQSMKHLPSVMIWGEMSVNRMAGLFSYHQEWPWMTKSTLICWRTSWNYIWPSINAKFLYRMVHHVTAPKLLLSFWSQRKFKILDWSGNHLNPIENLWTVLKEKCLRNNQLVLRNW